MYQMPIFARKISIDDSKSEEDFAEREIDSGFLVSMILLDYVLGSILF